MNETQLTVVGNVATPVKGRRLPNGDMVAKFRIASTERRRGAEGGWADGDSLFVSVTCWRQLAENVLASVGVGDPVMVRGRLYTDTYEWEGRPRAEITLAGLAVGPDLSRCKVAITRMRRNGVPAGPAAGGAGAERGAEGPAEAGDAWPTDGAGRTVPATGERDHTAADRSSDDRRERLGASVEAGVGV